MRKARKKLVLTILVTGAVFFNAFVSFAAWEQSEAGWKYKDDTSGVYLSNGWYWLDGNNDGISECYYLDHTGIMAVNTTIENYAVNADGQWTIDHVVQTQQDSGTAGNTSAQDSYVKTEIVECIGKDRTYIENKLGAPDSESSLDDSIVLRYNDLHFYVLKDTGLVDFISSEKLSALCNTLNGGEFNWNDSAADNIKEIKRGMGEPQRAGGIQPYWPFYVNEHEYWLVHSIGAYFIM